MALRTVFSVSGRLQSFSAAEGSSPRDQRLLAFGRETRAQNREFSPIFRLTPRSPVSNAFIGKVNRAYRALPPYLQQALEDSGLKIILSRFLTGGFPKLKGKQPDGWHPGDTWDNVDGLTIGNGRNCRIGLAEFAWDTPRKSATRQWNDPRRYNRKHYDVDLTRWQIVRPKQYDARNCLLLKTIWPGRILRHEVGHAVDRLLNGFAASKAFADAYRADYRLLPRNLKRRWKMNYTLLNPKTRKPGAIAKEETFAEVFASLYGGGCDYVYLMRKHFKNVTAVIIQALRELEASKKSVRKAA